MDNLNLEYIAILKDKTKPSGLRMEYLYFDGDNKITEESKRIALSESVDRVLLCYREVNTSDYIFCKSMVEQGKMTPEEAQGLLS